MQHQLSKSETMTSLWLIIVLTSPLSLAIYSDTTSFSVVSGMSIRADVENVVILEDMGTEITCAITCFNLPTLAAYKYNSETKQCICYTQLCEDDVYDNSTDYFHYNSYHRMRPAAQCYCRQFKCLYFYSSRNGTWQESVQACSSQQLQLLLLQSDVETTWLQSVVQLQREHNHTVKTHVWQDGTDVSSTRPWQTSAGVRLQYLNFADNEPNNQGGVEDCLELNTRSMLWNDRECNVVQDIVCQMDNQQ